MQEKFLLFPLGQREYTEYTYLFTHNEDHNHASICCIPRREVTEHINASANAWCQIVTSTIECQPWILHHFLPLSTPGLSHWHGASVPCQEHQSTSKSRLYTYIHWTRRSLCRSTINPGRPHVLTGRFPDLEQSAGWRPFGSPASSLTNF